MEFPEQGWPIIVTNLEFNGEEGKREEPQPPPISGSGGQEEERQEMSGAGEGPAQQKGELIGRSNGPGEGGDSSMRMVGGAGKNRRGRVETPAAEAREEITYTVSEVVGELPGEPYNNCAARGISRAQRKAGEIILVHCCHRNCRAVGKKLSLALRKGQVGSAATQPLGKEANG